MSEEESTITRPISNLLENQGQRSYGLMVVAGPSLGKMFRLSGNSVLIGRSKEAEIQLESESISRRHVRLNMLEGGGAELEELGSKNGTYLNGERFTETRTLANGDKFQVGSETVLRFSMLDPMDDAVQQLLYDNSVRDPLTGAFNRRFFDEILQKEFAWSTRHETPLSLLIMDVDHFKSINDTRGHGAGDAALTELVRTLQAALRAEDALSRYGGEEFCLVLREITEDVAVAVAERLRRTVASLRIPYRGDAIELTVSIGVATQAGGLFKTPEDLVTAADRYLLAAKARGRNQVQSRWLA